LNEQNDRPDLLL